MNAYFHAMRHSFDFSGRTTRSQFWLFTLMFLIVATVAVAIDLSINDTAGELGPIAILITIIHLIPSLSITVRRLHDIGRSGWWILIGLVPIVGIITLLVFACTGSQTGENKYSAIPINLEPDAASLKSDNGTTGQLDEIEKLAALRTSGAISEEEFQNLKSKTLTRAAN